MQTSAGNIDTLLEIWAAQALLAGGTGPFDSAEDLYSTIDSIRLGSASWESFTVRYTGPLTAKSAPWKRATYEVHTRNALEVVEDQVGSADFVDKFDYIPFEEYTEPGQRRWSNLMSGHWAKKKSVCLCYTIFTFLKLMHVQDEIARDPATHGSMFVPIGSGADKTTVSVATGNTEFHPYYLFVGNIHNDMRRAHRSALVPLAFLSIPKSEFLVCSMIYSHRLPIYTACRQYEDDPEFRLFRKQLYHASIVRILSPLRPGMTTPVVLRCPDGHYRRAIFELGPFIADYPEQVLASGVVQGWCPK